MSSRTLPDSFPCLQITPSNPEGTHISPKPKSPTSHKVFPLYYLLTRPPYTLAPWGLCDWSGIRCSGRSSGIARVSHSQIQYERDVGGSKRILRKRGRTSQCLKRRGCCGLIFFPAVVQLETPFLLQAGRISPAEATGYNIVVIVCCASCGWVVPVARPRPSL